VSGEPSASGRHTYLTTTFTEATYYVKRGTRLDVIRGVVRVWGASRGKGGVMRTIACWLLLGAISAGCSSIVSADPKVVSKARPRTVWTTTYVTMHGPVAATPESPLEATLTFKGAVRLPSNVTLPPGTYHFQMVAPNMLRISSMGDARILATFATTVVTRSRDLDQPLVRFERTAYDRPPRLMAIFPENASVGYQLSVPNDHRRGPWVVATAGTR